VSALEDATAAWRGPVRVIHGLSREDWDVRVAIRAAELAKASDRLLLQAERIAEETWRAETERLGFNPLKGAPWPFTTRPR
jgi:hypothetical protein